MPDINLAAILSGQDPLAAQMVPGYQIAQRTQAALNPENPGGILGGLGKALMGLDSGGLQPAVQNVVNQRVANQQNLAQLMAQPDPFAALAGASPGQYSAQSGAAVLAGATPESVAEARLKAAQSQFFGAKANFAQYLMNHPGVAALSALGPGQGAPGAGGSGGGGNTDDPRGLVPFIAQTAEKYNIDPAVAVKVAASEGLGNPSGDGGTSGGAFQLHLTPGGKGNAVGDRFVAQTGLDPRNPANERASIDFALRHASQNGWGAWNGATKAGITPYQGIRTQTAANTAQPPLTGTDALAGVGQQGDAVATLAQRIAGGNSPTPGDIQQARVLIARGQGAPPQAGPQAAPPEGAATPQAGAPPSAATTSPPAGGQINSAEAQRRADIASALGETPPAYINEAAGLPFVGPKAEAQARGETAGKPQILRQGGSLWEKDPRTGEWKLQAQSPVLPSGTELVPGPGGPVAREVPNANQAIQNTARATETGKAQGELGGIPGVNLGVPPPPVGPGQPPNQPSTAPGQPPAIAPNQPVITPRGTKLPPLSEQALPQSPEELKNDLPEWRKTSQEWTNAILPARQAEMRLMTIAQAFKMTESGAYETNKAQLAAALKGLGIDPNLVTNTDPTAVQLALHENMLTTLPLLKAATPRPSQIEFTTVNENREHPNVQPAANLRMLTEDVSLVRQAQQLPLDWNDAFKAGWRNPDSFLAHWNGLNSLEDTRSQVEKEIGPLKGMPGFQGPGQPAAPVATHRVDPKTGQIVPLVPQQAR